MHGEMVAQIMDAAFPRRPGPARRSWRSGDPIRVGVVSAMFWRHSVWRLPTRGWLENMNRERFQLLGYHVGARRDDQTAEAARLFDRFAQGPRGLAEWVATIERDAPHVLIYPEIASDQTTLQLAALRLAPVQCTSWGQPATSGLPTIDYYLSSEAMEPPDGDAHYTERLVRLPGLGTAYDPAWAAWGDPLPAADAWATPDLPANGVRFLCCQSVTKYLPAHDEVIPRIAAELPAARFVFVEIRPGPTAIFRRRLEAAFARRGLCADDFCRFVPGRPHAAFSALIRDADVFLDSIEWSGCNTTLDALAHGVPVVTLPGPLMRGRHSLAILTAADATETIAESVDGYVEHAVRLGRDTNWRRHVRSMMRRGAARVFNDVAPVRALERFLTEAVQMADTFDAKGFGKTYPQEFSSRGHMGKKGATATPAEYF
jgi:predicted O-linked N-acetylglucosamine transferase (SPINDLY family)